MLIFNVFICNKLNGYSRRGNVTRSQQDFKRDARCLSAITVIAIKAA